MFIVRNVTNVTQRQNSNPGLATPEAHACNCSSEVPPEDSDVTSPCNLAECLFSY